MAEETRRMIDDLAGKPEAEEPEQEDGQEQEEPGEQEVDDAVIKDLIAELKKFDIVLPDDTNEDNFFERLQVGLKTAAAHEGLDEPQAAEGQDSQITVAENGGMSMMSLEVRTALDKAGRAHAYAENQHREATGAQLQSLLASGRCTPAEFHERTAALSAVRLSLDASGNPEPSDLDKWIASRQPLPKGTFWDAKERTVNMALDVEEHPAPLTGREDEARANAVAALVMKRYAKT